MKDNVEKAVDVSRGSMVIDGAGVRLNRIIGFRRVNYIYPFVLLDELKSDDPNDHIAGSS